MKEGHNGSNYAGGLKKRLRLQKKRNAHEDETNKCQLSGASEEKRSRAA